MLRCYKIKIFENNYWNLFFDMYILFNLIVFLMDNGFFVGVVSV